MASVYDSDRNEIGHFDGSFVYDHSGVKIYWIDDGEVFSPPTRGDNCQLGSRASVKIGNFSDRVAIDHEGVTIFTLDKTQ